MLIDQLKKQYDIDCFVFLEDLECSPSSTLYRTLAPFYKTAYEPNYRFVFLNFSKLKKSTLDRTVKTVDYLDISRFFVLVITDQPETFDYFDSFDNPFSLQLIDYKLEHSLPTTDVVPMFANSDMCACLLYTSPSPRD